MNKKISIGIISLVAILSLSLVSTNTEAEMNCLATGDPTKADSKVPEKRLGVNRWTLNHDLEWQTKKPRGKGPQKDFTLEDTSGCNCEQILGWLHEQDPERFGEMKGHYKFGCSISVMEEFISLFEEPTCNDYYLDEDQDGYGVDGDTQCLVEPSFPYTANQGGDCDDSNPDVNPGSEEVCNNQIDDDCDGDIDCGDTDCQGSIYCPGSS